MALVRNYFRGFASGPDFKNTKRIAFVLEDSELCVTVPMSDIITDEPPRDINFPFKQEGWFDKNREQERQHLYVNIYTDFWYYFPPVSISPGSEYGMLALSIWLKRVPSHINALDRKALAKAVVEEYEQHYNSPKVGGPGEHGLGVNTKIRKKVAEQSAARATPFSEDRLAREVALSIEQSGGVPIAPAEVVTLNDQDWVFYREDNPSRTKSRQDFYCFPLDECYYLQVRFKHRVDRSEKVAWQKDANEAQQKILNALRVNAKA